MNPQWQPIDTAPHNQMVLLWVANAYGHEHVKTGMSHPINYPELEVISVYEDGETLGWMTELYATHWMPLPTPPTD